MQAPAALGAVREIGIAFEDVEHLDQDARRRRRAAASRRCRSRDSCRAPAARSIGAIVLRGRRRHDAAGGAHRRAISLSAIGAFVEGARPVCGDRRERVGEIALHQPVAAAERRAVGA